MSPTTSKLLLDNYFIEELNCKVNFEHNPELASDISLKDITVTADVLAGRKKSEGWQVRLTVFHQTEGESNSPYSFRIVLVGFFRVDDNYPTDRAEWLVKTNAPSVLYSIARENIRRVTVDGPWRCVLLPTVSFYTDELKALICKKSTKQSLPNGKKNRIGKDCP